MPHRTAPGAPGTAPQASGPKAGLHQAIRHHRRAIRTLEGGGFEGLSAVRTEQLLHRLRRDLHQLEEQLGGPGGVDA